MEGKDVTAASNDSQGFNTLGCLTILVLIGIPLFMYFLFFFEFPGGEEQVAETAGVSTFEVKLPEPGEGEELLEYNAGDATFGFVVPIGTKITSEEIHGDRFAYFNYPNVDTTLFWSEDPLSVDNNCEQYNNTYLKSNDNPVYRYQRMIFEGEVEACVLASPPGDLRYLYIDIPYGGYGYGISVTSFGSGETEGSLPINGYLQLPDGPALIFEDGFETGDTSRWSKEL